MGKSLLFTSFLFFIIIDSASSSCLIDLSFVDTYPWDRSLCLDPDGKHCCQTLLSLIGMGLALHLRDTSMFQLPNDTVSSSCFSDFQTKLAALSINPSFVTRCFSDATQFASSNSSCAGIVTTRDWVEKVGPTSALDLACTNLTGLTKCSSCIDAGYQVNSQLVSISPNSTKCFYFVVLYAVDILNDPKDEDAAACILGLSISSSTIKKPSGNKRQIRLAIALLGAFVGLLLVFSMIILLESMFTCHL